jgi:RNA polymerase sigma-70 factor (ECF subfamily)
MSTTCLRTHITPNAAVHSARPALSDEKLIALLATGDRDAMRTLFARHHARVLRFVLRFVKDRDAADDVVNDTFLIAWQQAPRFEGRSQVATWLLGIARYRALATTKRRRAALEPLDEQHEAALVDPCERADALMQREDSRRYLKRCLAALPPEQAVLIELHYFHDKSLKEAASLTGVPLNTIKTRMFLARKKLAAMLAVEDCGFAALEVTGHDRRTLRQLDAQPC